MRTELVEEANTIYEIDLDCVAKNAGEILEPEVVKEAVVDRTGVTCKGNVSICQADGKWIAILIWLCLLR